MLFGYARVSKADGSQLLDLQRDALIEASVDAERIYEDKASGRKDHRPGLDACMKALQPGNSLVIWKLDRLGRDLRHLVATVDGLRERGIGLRVLSVPVRRLTRPPSMVGLCLESSLVLPNSSANSSLNAPAPDWLRRVRGVGKMGVRARWT